MSVLRDRVLLREVIQGLLLEKTLSPKAMSERPKRWGLFLAKVQGGVPFTLSPSAGGGEVVLKPAATLIKALKGHDVEALERALLAQGIQYLGHLEKTADLGGGKTTKETRAGKNETVVADVINAQVSVTGGPITAVFGDFDVAGVLSAEHVGMKNSSASKPDIILHIEGGIDFTISIKDVRGMYYQSGDRMMTPIVTPVINTLKDAKPPDPRLKQKDDGEWNTVVGPKKDAKPKNVKFPVDDVTAEKAAFHRGETDEVDIIVWGDMSHPEIKGNVVAWPDIECYTSVKELPPEQEPVGLIRHGAGRFAHTTDGRSYKGLRPTIATAKRASAAVQVKPT
jgi:hypothetical protein